MLAQQQEQRCPSTQAWGKGKLLSGRMLSISQRNHDQKEPSSLLVTLPTHCLCYNSAPSAA